MYINGYIIKFIISKLKQKLSMSFFPVGVMQKIA